jgi:hypothetical protein
MSPAGHFDNIRQVLGSLIGKTVVDITQHDADEWEETRASYIQFHFDNGDYVRIYVGSEGFTHSCVEEIDDTQTG